MSARTIYRHDKPIHRRPYFLLSALAVVLVAAAGIGLWNRHQDRPFLSRPTTATPKNATTAGPVNGAGTVLGIDSVRDFTAIEAQTVSKQNYAATAPVITTGVTKVTFHYRSLDTDGTPLTIYGRAYLPDDATTNLPIFAFAPGTVGVGQQCAPSLEVVTPATSYGNYDSHMITYASQGYAAVTTDYQGFRNPGQMHDYMVGAVEGRAVLDSIRALEHLDQAQGRLDTSKIFAAGYSQGGHAAFWADTINASYAPDIKLTGIIGFGAVLSVEETMNDVTRGSILDWFGPYVLTAYTNYYHHTYNIDNILQGRYAANLASDVTSHCVDTAYSFWGHDDSKVYTPAYLSSIDNGTFASQYAVLAHDLAINATGTEPTATAKLLNQGHNDVVVLPGQAEAALPTMCRNSLGPVALKDYPTATHFNTMVVSLSDTLAWMKQLREGDKPAATCPAS